MIDNWPPGYPDSISPPEGLVRKIQELDAKLFDARQELAEWKRTTIIRRSRAWVEYHDGTGWPPSERGYEARLRHIAGTED